MRKPAPRLRPYFAALLDEFARRQKPGWLDASIDLLRLGSYEEQKRIERGMEELKGRVNANWRDPAHISSLIVSPPHIRETAGIFYVYPRQLADRRRDHAGDIAGEALAMTKRERCIIIGRCTDDWARPYHFWGIATNRPENDA